MTQGKVYRWSEFQNLPPKTLIFVKFEKSTKNSQNVLLLFYNLGRENSQLKVLIVDGQEAP